MAEQSRRQTSFAGARPSETHLGLCEFSLWRWSRRRCPQGRNSPIAFVGFTGRLMAYDVDAGIAALLGKEALGALGAHLNFR